MAPVPLPIPFHGIQAGSLFDYSEPKFKDRMKQSRLPVERLKVGGTVAANPITDPDAAGWPATFDTVNRYVDFIFNSTTHIRTGTWVCTWDGIGEVKFDALFGQVAQGTGNRLEVTVTSVDSNAWRIWILDSTPGNYVRNIKVFHIDDEATLISDPWEGWFLDSLRELRINAMRFMDWMGTNNCDITTAADIVPDGYFTTNYLDYDGNEAPAGNFSRGCAFEWIVDIANRLDLDYVWLCAPHLADLGSGPTSWAVAAAQYFRNNLQTDVILLIEHSNECWNSQFGQTAYGQTLTEYPVGTPLEGASTFERMEQWHATRSKELFTTFKTIWTDRLLRVIAGWATVGGEPSWLRRYNVGIASPVPVPFDVISPSGYYGNNFYLDNYDPGDPDGLAVWTNADYKAYLINDINNRVFAPVVSYGPGDRHGGLPLEAQLATEKNLHMVCYESGPHDTNGSPSWEPASVAKIIAFQSTQEQADCLSHSLNRISAIGAYTCHYYLDGNWDETNALGFWGLYPHSIDPDSTTKWKAYYYFANTVLGLLYSHLDDPGVAGIEPANRSSISKLLKEMSSTWKGRGRTRDLT